MLKPFITENQNQKALDLCHKRLKETGPKELSFERSRRISSAVHDMILVCSIFKSAVSVYDDGKYLKNCPFGRRGGGILHDRFLLNGVFNKANLLRFAYKKRLVDVLKTAQETVVLVYTVHRAITKGNNQEFSKKWP